jgi:molybdate transport system permease protein
MTTDELFPIALSLRVGLAALAIVTPVGVALAWLQARLRYRLSRVVDALVLLPLVLPPSVVGFVLVVVLGRRGPIGGLLDRGLGVRLVFTPAAAVIASAVVALPLLVKTAQPAIEAVPDALEEVARTLGLSPVAVLFRVTLPAAWRGILAGVVLAFARALGEFGATLMFAGNVPGRTNTMPLEIFSAFLTGDDARAALYVGVLSAFSVGVVLVASRLGRSRLRPANLPG